MSIEVKTIDNEHIEVNGKLVYLDTNLNWVATVELTSNESEAAQRHIASLKRQSKD